MKKLSVALFTFFLTLSSFSVFANACSKKCKLKGEVVLWVLQYCKTKAETSDCEAKAVQDCIESESKLKDQESCECDIKKEFHKKRCDLYKEPEDKKKCLTTILKPKDLQCGESF